MNRIPRVTVLTNIPSYHQVDLFDAVARIGCIDNRVIYLRPITPGRRWTRLPKPAHNHATLPVWWNDKPWWLSPNVIQTLDSNRPDLLVICQYAGLAYQAAMYWAFACKIPFVFWSESIGVKHFEVNFGLPEYLKPLARKAMFFPAKMWATDLWGIGSRAQAQFESLTGRTCWNLPYYSDLTKFDRGSEPYAPGGTIRLLFAGRYSYRKGFDILLEALAELASRRPNLQWILTLAGAGDMEHMLMERRFASVRKRTTNVGFLELSEMPALMKRHDVFLCPSRHDGWGMVVPEALSAGMPVVASDEMGSALDIGEHECLRITGAGSTVSFIQGIEAVLDSNVGLAYLGAEAKTVSLSYSAPIGARRFVTMAKTALEAVASQKNKIF